MLLQVWDVVSGKLRKDLQFQADEQFMMHDTAVIALAVSRDSELLASGSQDGKIKVHARDMLCFCLPARHLHMHSPVHQAVFVALSVRQSLSLALMQMVKEGAL